MESGSRVDFGPVTASSIDEKLKSRRVHCSYDNNMLIYDLKPNRDVSKRFKYHVFKKPHKKNGKNSRRDDHAGDDDDENKETLEDVLSMYGITESQFRAWNDLITGHPVAGLTCIVNFVPHIVTKLVDLKNLHEHSITGWFATRS